MQATRGPIGDQIMPHAPGVVAPVAGDKAHAYLRTELFIAAAALTAPARE